MPYDIFSKDGEFCVYKVNADKQPVGETLGCHPTRKEASKQIAAVLISEEENSNLSHYGVKGMRWGVRKDRKTSRDYRESRSQLKKHFSELSNEDIRKLNNRLQMERQLASLDPTVGGNAKRLTGKFLQKYGNGLVGGLAGAAATATVSAIINKKIRG